MTTARIPDTGFGSGDLLNPEEGAKEGTEKSLQALNRKIHYEVRLQQQVLLRQTYEQWTKQVRADPEFRQALSRANTMTTTVVPRLPPSTQGRWQNRLSTLSSMGTRGDPLSILRYLSSIDLRNDLNNLDTLAAVGNESQQRAAREIREFLIDFADAIGPAHPGHTTEDRYRSRNPNLSARGANIIGTGVFLVAASAAIVAGMLAFFAKPEDRQWKVFGIWAAVALLAMSFGKMNQTGPQRLDSQIAFLVRPQGPWETLQNGGPENPAYVLSGPDWGTFFRQVYRTRATNTHLNAAMSNAGPLTAQQRKAVLAIAPASIHPRLEAMMDSGTGTARGRDFRRMITELNRAQTEEAQNIVVGYTQSGANADTLAMFAKARGGPVLPPGPGTTT